MPEPISSILPLREVRGGKCAACGEPLRLGTVTVICRDEKHGGYPDERARYEVYHEQCVLDNEAVRDLTNWCYWFDLTTGEDVFRWMIHQARKGWGDPVKLFAAIWPWIEQSRDDFPITKRRRVRDAA
jgi:hypothetical protein